MKKPIKEIALCLSLSLLMTGCNMLKKPVEIDTGNLEPDPVLTEQTVVEETNPSENEQEIENNTLENEDGKEDGNEDASLKVEEEYVPEKIQLESKEANGKAEELEKDGWEIFYSEDKSVYVKQNYETGESAIVDGKVEIPVELATGAYGPRVEKFDADGDGEDEILIAECEGTGTGMCLYGLCIVEKNDDGYLLTKYDFSYFTKLIEENIGFRYDNKTHEVSIYEILPPNFDRANVCTLKLDCEEELEAVIWSDIINITFEDEKVFLSAPSGYIFEGIPMPDYEQAILVKGQIFIGTDSKIGVPIWNIEPDEQ